MEEQQNLPESGALMQYTEEIPEQDFSFRDETVSARRVKKTNTPRKWPRVLLVFAVLAVLAVVLLYIFRVIPDVFGLFGDEEQTPPDISNGGDTGAGAENEPIPLSVAGHLLVFRVTDANGTRTIMEYAYETIAAPKGPGPLTQALASESALIDETYRSDPAYQGQISFDEYYNVTGFDVYQQEARISVMRADDTVCSFLKTTRINPGYYAFEYTGYEGVNIDVSSGDRITLDKLIADQALLYDVIVSLLSEDENRKNILTFYDTVGEDLRALIEDGLQFTLTDEAMQVWFSETDLGQGMISACSLEIPFADYKNLFRDNDYTALRQETEVISPLVTHQGMTEEVYELSDYLADYEISLKRNFFRELAGVWRLGGNKGTVSLRLYENGYLDYFDADGALLYDGYLEAVENRDHEYAFHAFVYDEEGEPNGVEVIGTLRVTEAQEIYLTIDGNLLYMLRDTSTE